jgi:hypothetical protein
MYENTPEYNGLEPGMKVKTPDGRTGILLNFRLNPYLETPASSRAVVQFFDRETGMFHVEPFTVGELEKS